MKEKIREIIIGLGADVCGFANIDRFQDTPAGFHPRDVFKRTKSVIVIAKALPRGLAYVSPRLVYKKANDINLEMLDHISYKASLEIQRLGGIAVPMPSDGPYDYWNAEKSEGRGLISMRHAAVHAGIGTIGKNTLVANEKFGNMISLGAILTDLDIQSDPPAREMCLAECRICLSGCPSQALDGGSVNQKRCRQYAYDTNQRGFDVTVCNKCRINCPRVFGV